MARPPLDPGRGAEAARKLKDLRAKRILIRAAELGYITEVTCRMPECFCPEEWGGRRYFKPVSAELSDWSPTHEHFPVPKREGGKATPDNTILAHRLCNRIDYSKAVGRSHRRDLERIRKAREAAAAANLSQSAAAEAVAEVFAPEPAYPAKSPRKRKAPAWKSLPPAEPAAHCSRPSRLPIPPGRQSRGSRARIVSPSFAASCSARPPSRPPKSRPPS